jgi:hypothetical protein
MECGYPEVVDFGKVKIGLLESAKKINNFKVLLCFMTFALCRGLGYQTLFS